jgi:hypothetical protein
LKIGWPPNSKLVDQDGNASKDYKNYFSLLANGLQTNLGADGYLHPEHTEDDIKKLNVSQNKGKTVFDKTNGLLKVNTDGTYHEILTGMLFLNLTNAEFSALNLSQINIKFIHVTDTSKLYFVINGQAGEINISWLP